MMRGLDTPMMSVVARLEQLQGLCLTRRPGSDVMSPVIRMVPVRVLRNEEMGKPPVGRGSLNYSGWLRGRNGVGRVVWRERAHS